MKLFKYKSLENLWTSPDKEVINRYMMPSKEAIILAPLVSETPLDEDSDYITPTIEGVLVNAWIKNTNMLAPIKESNRARLSDLNYFYHSIGCIL